MEGHVRSQTDLSPAKTGKGSTAQISAPVSGKGTVSLLTIIWASRYNSPTGNKKPVIVFPPNACVNTGFADSSGCTRPAEKRSVLILLQLLDLPVCVLVLQVASP